MNTKEIRKILADIDYVRTGGSKEELKAAEYLKEECIKRGAEAHIESFPVQMATIKEAKLVAGGREIPCRGFNNCGSGDVTAPFYYMPNNDKASLAQAKGKIVMLDTGVGYFGYKDLIDNGAVGIITYNGNMNFRDSDIDQRELRQLITKSLPKIPMVNLNVKDAVKLVKSAPETVRVKVAQKEFKGESRNVVASIPGTYDEYIVLTAHYDSTFLSRGSYDNLTGCIGLLGLIDAMKKSAPNRYGLKFIFCGGEERGLLGSKAYTADHEKELEKCVLNINLDMIGSIMGRFIACATAEDKLVSYISYLSMELGWGMAARQGVYSSDSTPFADKGVPAVSFARFAPANVAPIHNRYDTKDLVSVDQMMKDIEFITIFTDRMANAVKCPVAREIPENMKKELDEYLSRKRKDA